MQQIITHFTDDDLYKFTMCCAVIDNYPRAQVQYQFVDRSNRVYPAGFADALRRYDGGGKYHQQNHDEEGVEMQAAERVHGRGGGCEGGEYNKACCARTRDKPAHKKRAAQAALHAS